MKDARSKSQSETLFGLPPDWPRPSRRRPLESLDDYRERVQSEFWAGFMAILMNPETPITEEIRESLAQSGMSQRRPLESLDDYRERLKSEVWDAFTARLIDEARKGSRGGLIGYLDNPEAPITKGLRKFMADVLRGDERPPGHRPKSDAAARRNRAIAWFVALRRREGMNIEAAIAEACKSEKFGKVLDRRTVQRAMKQYPTPVEVVNDLINCGFVAPENIEDYVKF